MNEKVKRMEGSKFLHKELEDGIANIVRFYCVLYSCQLRSKGTLTQKIMQCKLTCQLTQIKFQEDKSQARCSLQDLCIVQILKTSV